MRVEALTFLAPYRVTVEPVDLPAPQPGEARVRTLFSAISSGTEKLFYRGEAPPGLALDASLSSLRGDIAYPLRYGYSSVGVVEEVGADDDTSWAGRWVFAFQPHASGFVAPIASLVALPENLDAAQATLLPSVETALTLVLDAAPRFGERVAVFGQGVVGLLATSLLSRFPLSQLIVVEPDAKRQALALRRGAQRALAPVDAVALHDMDIVIEVSGNPQALDAVISATGFDGRIVVGSWYGTRRATVDLGSHFHRNRIQLIASQVSTIAPHLSGRWNRERRMAEVLHLLPQLDLGSLISHRFPLAQAADAYALIADHRAGVLQVIFDYAHFAT